MLTQAWFATERPIPDAIEPVPSRTQIVVYYSSQKNYINTYLHMFYWMLKYLLSGSICYCNGTSTHLSQKESDQYALGCIAYQAMTGRLPFDSLDFIALGFKHLSESPIPPSQHNRLIPETVEAAILRAMAKERTQRFPDIRSFVEALGGTLPSNDSLLATLPSTGRIAAVVQPLRAGGNDATVLPHLLIEERGQSVLSMSGHDSGDGLTASSNLVDTPAHAEVSHILLSNESPGVRTPTLSATEWNNYSRDEQEDVPTLLSVGSTSSLGAEEMKTLPAGTPLPIDPQWPNSKPSQHKKCWHIRPVFIAVIITLLVALIGGGVLYAMKGVIPRSPSVQTWTAQVNITPQQTLLNKTYTISAILGTPNASKQQVQARSISSSSTTQSITVSATGQGTTPAKEATGYIYMKNLQTNSTLLYYANSSQSYFQHGSITVYLSQGGVLQPGASTTIPAYATPAGSGGNLPAGTFNQNFSCNNGNLQNCSYVYNYAFSGGSNSSSYTYVSQSDVNSANNQVVNQYEAGETSSAKSNVEGQVSSNEQMLKGIGCSQQLSDNQSAGNHASSITAFLSMSCSGEVYAPNSAQSLTVSLLQNSITSTPGEKLIGKISTHVLSVSVGANGTVILQIEAKGTEVYTFSATQLQLMKASIVGKSLQEAQAILNKQPGVSNATVILSSADEKTMPKDTKDITMVLLK